MKCELLCINLTYIDTIWPLVSGLVKSAMEKTNLSDFAVIEADVRAGRALLWVAAQGQKAQAAAVTQVSKANGRKYCTVVACGGVDRSEWLSLLDGIEDYARNEMCAAMRIFGRMGWSRVLPEYKIIGLITEKQIEPMNAHVEGSD